MSNLTELAQQLAEARAMLGNAKDVEEMRQAELEKLPAYVEYADAKAQRMAAAQAESELKQVLSDAMIEHAHKTGETKFDFGQVINRKSVEIVNDKAALAWAIERQICLQLDTRAIKKVAEELKPDGVGIIEEKSTRINSDLAEFLPNGS